MQRNNVRFQPGTATYVPSEQWIVETSCWQLPSSWMALTQIWSSTQVPQLLWLVKKHFVDCKRVAWHFPYQKRSRSHTTNQSLWEIWKSTPSTVWCLCLSCYWYRVYMCASN